MLNSEQIQQMQAYLERGGTLQQLKQIPSQQLDTLYAHAHHCYQQGQIKAAKNFFQLLVNCNQWRFDAQLGLGLCYQRLGQHQAAAETLSHAAFIKLSDPRPPYFCGVSYQALGDFAKASQAFQAALKWCIAHPEMDALQQDATRKLAAVTLRR